MRKAILSLILAGSAISTTGHALSRPAARTSSHQQDQSVKIYRDGKGVPHIFADTAPAVMFGLGYATAHDRLAQLELKRRGVIGRRAEILGKDAIESDETALDRALPAAELMRMYRAMPAEYQAMMQGFVDGINRYVDEVEKSPRTKTPYEFQKWGIRPSHWTLLDYLAVIAATP